MRQGRLTTYLSILDIPLEPRDSDSSSSKPHINILILKHAQILDARVSATTPSRLTITPLFYSRSTDLPVLRGRRCVRGALERPQTGGLYNKFAFEAV
jgi:hypothetical protein